MFRHQFNMCCKKVVVPAMASLFLISGTVCVDAATVMKRSFGFTDDFTGGTVFSEFKTSQENNSSNAGMNVTNAPFVSAETYNGATILSNTTMTFSNDFTLYDGINSTSNVNISFEGNKNSTLTILNTNFEAQSGVSFGGEGDYWVNGGIEVGGSEGVTKTGSGTMTQNWGAGNADAASVNVNEGTYYATGKITASQLTIDGGMAYVANRSEIRGDVTIGEQGAFGIGENSNASQSAVPALFQSDYQASSDSTLLNRVGVIDVNGNMRIDGRLVVNVKNGQMDIINVSGKISLGENFKFVMNVDSMEDIDGMFEQTFLKGELDDESKALLQKLSDEGTLAAHVEGDGIFLSLKNGVLAASDYAMVPEPATWVLLVLGACGLGCLRKRK